MKIKDFVYNGLNIKSDKMDESMMNLSNQILNEFGSKTKFIKYFKNLNLDVMVEARLSSPESYLNDLKFGFLLIPKSDYTINECVSYYRIMQNIASDMNSENWYYSNKNIISKDYRFNKQGENVLYISSCINVAMQEALQNFFGTCSLIEYKVPTGFNYYVIGRPPISINQIYTSYYEFSNYIFNDLIHSPLRLKYEKNQYYVVINEILDYIGVNSDGVAKIASDKFCRNINCLKHSIGVFEKSEKMLQPISVTEYEVVSGEIGDSVFKVKKLKKYLYEELVQS